VLSVWLVVSGPQQYTSSDNYKKIVLFKSVFTQLKVLTDGADIFSQVYASSSDSLLHLVCREGLEESGLLLCLHGANPNHVNKKVSSPFCFNQVSV